MQKTLFKPIPRIAAANRVEQRLWERAGPIMRAVRSEEDILRAELAAYARTGVCFVSCVWDIDSPPAAPAHLELLRWDIVKGDVWVIYHWVADAQ